MESFSFSRQISIKKNRWYSINLDYTSAKKYITKRYKSSQTGTSVFTLMKKRLQKMCWENKYGNLQKTGD